MGLSTAPVPSLLPPTEVRGQRPLRFRACRCFLTPPQFGFDTTTTLGNATVAYLELSSGNSRSLWKQVLHLSGENTFHTRLATGLTYTTSARVSLTLEYEYDGAALSGHD